MGNETQIYFSDNGIKPDAIELPSELNDRDLLTAFVESTLDFELSDGFNVSQDLSEVSTELLKMRARNVLLAAQSNPDYRALLMNGARLNDMANLWSANAAQSASGSGSAVEAFYAQTASQELTSARSMMQDAVSQDEFLRGAARFGAGAGRLLGALGMILEVGEGLYTGIADDTFKGIFSALIGGIGTYLAGMALGIGLLVGWEFVAAAVLVGAAGYLASKFGQAVWDYFLGDIVWDALDALGLGDGVRSAFHEVHDSLFGTQDGELTEIPATMVEDTFFEVEGDRVIAYGGTGNDNFSTNSGQNVFYGGVGDDAYIYETQNLSGVQTIVDSDGQGSIEIDGIDVGNEARTRISDTVWKSNDGKLRFTVIINSGRQHLVIESTQTGRSIVVNDWTNGDLDITLDGEISQADSGITLTGDEDLFGHTGTNTGNDIVNGLAGNDGIDGGAGADYLDGGANDDLLLGGAGDDRIFGGSGNDLIIDGSEQADMRPWTASEAQAEEAAIASYGAAVVARGASWYVTGTGNALVAHAPEWTYLDPNTNQSGNDFIDAGDGDDNVWAGEGDDVIVGGIGNDFLMGGHDNDTISGGTGDDIIRGDLSISATTGVSLTAAVSDQAIANGNDILDGGDGNDSIYGMGGNDVIYGGEGNDSLAGFGSGNDQEADDPDADYIDGGNGNDVIDGGAGRDTLLGGDGDDSLLGDNANVAVALQDDDVLDGGAGNDTLQGFGGNDILSGGTGVDLLIGDSTTVAGDAHGKDLIQGGSENDTAMGMGGDDVIYGDEGDDDLQGDANEAELALQYHGNDLVYGGAGNDQIWGGGGNDTLDGGTGIDALSGDTGNDRLSGGADNDQLWGGDGDDVLDGGDGADQLSGGEGSDTQRGGAGDDLINSGSGDDQVDGGLGNDQIDGADGNDRLNGGDGADLIYGNAGADTLSGDVGNDTMNSGAGDDQIYGGSGDDQINGDEGNDRVEGGEGSDQVQGAAGDDVLVGGAGNDFLAGGAGNDTYLFERGWGSDVIQQMGAADSGIDVISFGADIEASDLSFTVAGENLVISLIGSDDIITAAGYFSPNASVSLAFADGSVITHQDLLQTLGVAIGTGSDDTINGTAGDDNLYGGDGNDTINGLAGNDKLYGGNGNDTLLGGIGNDVLDGGAGNDTYHYDGHGYDTILGLADANAGEDVVQVALTSSRSSNFQISGNDLIIDFTNANGTLGGLMLEGFMDAGNGGHRIEFAGGAILTIEDSVVSIAGTAGNDELRGYDSADTLTGYAGNDQLTGYAGNDILNGGSGTDRLYGGTGNDVYRFGTGSEVDTIYEDRGEGFDVIEIGTGISPADVTFSNTSEGVQLLVNGTNDRILLQGFVDDSNYEIGTHIPSQESGIEEIRFADGTVWDYAELVRRLLLGTESDQSIVGTEIADVIDAAGGDDLVTASAGDDIIAGGSGSDYLDGGDGDDIITGGSDNDNLTGGHGNDAYRFELGFGVDVISHEYIGGDDDSDYFDSIEFGAGISPDSISFARSGFDLEITVEGTGGADKIVLPLYFEREIWYDQINSWINEIRFADGTVWDLAEIHRQMGEGTEYDDTYKGTAADDVVTGLAGNDELYGQDGNDSLDGGDGNDRLNGDAGNDMLSGGAGDDELDGGDGYNDESTGFLVFVPDTDTLEGGEGNDTLRGGIFQDAYVFNRGDGQDTVLEYGNEFGSGSYSEGLAETDIFRFGEDISVSDLEVTQESEDLVVRIAGSTDQITFANWFAGAEYQVEQFQFADGTVLSASEILTAPSTAGDDDLVGTDEDDYIDGLAGNDVISGLAGNDDLIGGEGNDILMGGSGDDYLEGQSGDDVYRFQLGDGVDHIYNYDEAFDGSDFDVVEFGAGIAPGDIVLSDEGYGLKFQVAGTDDALVVDWHFYEEMSGEGTFSVDEIRFADGTVWGQAAIAGMISGMVVDKIIEGTGEDDTLQGGAGNDTLYGDYGSDTYRFEAGFGHDIINDSSEGSEEVDVVEFGSGLLASDFIVSQSGQDLILATANESLTIEAYFYESDYIDYSIDEFRFADGTVWDRAQIAQMLLPDAEASQTVYGSAQDDMGDIQTKPPMISDGAYQSDQAGSVSDYHNLITMMGIAGRFDREAFNPHESDRMYALTP